MKTKNNGIKAVFLIAGILGLIGCASMCSEQSSASRQVKAVESLFNIGDNIYDARERVVKEGYRATEVIFTTVSKRNLSFVIRIKDYDSLDKLGYAINKSLKPSQNTPYNIVVTADKKGNITEVEAK